MTDKISFLIVNWNGGEIFKKCIKSIILDCRHSKISKYEIVVVDNHSADDNLQWLNRIPKVILIRNKENKYFAYATNQTVKHSTGKILFILNNDIIINKGFTSILLGRLKKYKLIAPRLILPNGKTQVSLVGIPTVKSIYQAVFNYGLLSKKHDQWLNLNIKFDTPQEFKTQASFSAIALNRKTWEQVGDMDTKFPLLWNDVDWFNRYYKLYDTCFYEPKATAKHIHGMSVNKSGRIKKIFKSTISMFDYFKKNEPGNFFLLLFLCTITLIMRLVREIILITKEKLLSQQ